LQRGPTPSQGSGRRRGRRRGVTASDADADAGTDAGHRNGIGNDSNRQVRATGLFKVVLGSERVKGSENLGSRERLAWIEISGMRKESVICDTAGREPSAKLEVDRTAEVRP
jgi:hypothetical protein